MTVIHNALTKKVPLEISRLDYKYRVFVYRKLKHFSFHQNETFCNIIIPLIKILREPSLNSFIFYIIIMCMSVKNNLFPVIEMIHEHWYEKDKNLP